MIPLLCGFLVYQPRIQYIGNKYYKDRDVHDLSHSDCA